MTEPMTAERRAEIQDRALRVTCAPDSPGSYFTMRDSAMDVPALLAEVDRLRALWAAVAKTSQERKAEADGRRQHAEKLKAEIARLRAGESEKPAALGVEMTPAEFIHKWNAATVERRLGFAATVLEKVYTESNCFVMGHEARIEEDACRIEQLAKRAEEAEAELKKVRQCGEILMSRIDTTRAALVSLDQAITGIGDAPAEAEVRAAYDDLVATLGLPEEGDGR